MALNKNIKYIGIAASIIFALSACSSTNSPKHHQTKAHHAHSTSNEKQQNSTNNSTTSNDSQSSSSATQNNNKTNQEGQSKSVAKNATKQETVKYVGQEDDHSIEVVTSKGDNVPFQVTDQALPSIEQLKEGDMILITYENENGEDTIIKAVKK